ncbi:GtrA family protein [Pseudactinotalea sp. Z1739]|uniref:GtrA family protein n=1 Tax=Pseudactinotalea sp. Z1739 TaxID=3413028 RepID=UPI003C7C3CCD
MTRASAPAPARPVGRIGSTWRSRSEIVARVAEMARFGSVGLVAFVVDVGLFNLLRFGPGQVLVDQPLTAKVASVSVAVLVAWLGNRYWTFATRRSTGGAAAHGTELARFVLANLIGMGIAVGCLAVSHYLLGFTSPLADNIAANGVGLALGTLFRYLAYRHWVFTGSAVGTSRG